MLPDQHLNRAQRDNATSFTRRRRRQARTNLALLIMLRGMAAGEAAVKRKVLQPTRSATAK